MSRTGLTNTDSASRPVSGDDDVSWGGSRVGRNLEQPGEMRAGGRLEGDKKETDCQGARICHVAKCFISRPCPATRVLTALPLSLSARPGLAVKLLGSLR